MLATNLTQEGVFVMSIPKLFSPGPVMVRSNVRNALLHYDICHRSSEFEELFTDTQKKINFLMGADQNYFSMVISGSGTSANETVLSSLFQEKDQVLLIRNGVFGERLLEIIDKYQIPKAEVAFPWGTYPDLAVIEEAISTHPEARVVAMVYHETSTGMINPVPEVGKLCRKYGRLFFVDAVSAAGGETIDMAENHIAVATSVGGKCLGAFPGSAYICARKTILETLTPDQCKNVYLNLYKHYKAARDSCQTPNTPNVNLIWPLNQALTNLLEEGLENRIARYQRCSAIIRDGFRQMGLRMLLEDHQSNTVTSVFLPDHVPAPEFLRKMEMRDYIFYLGKGPYASQNMIQVANMGEIYEQDCYNMLDVFSACLKTFSAG